MSETVEQPKRTGLLIWLIVSQLLALASLVIWFFGAAISMFAKSTESPPLWLIAFYLYPIYPLGISIGAWIAYYRHKNRPAAILSALLIPPLFLFCLFIVLNS
jgi:hypothetical protein